MPASAPGNLTITPLDANGNPTGKPITLTGPKSVLTQVNVIPLPSATGRLSTTNPTAQKLSAAGTVTFGQAVQAIQNFGNSFHNLNHWSSWANMTTLNMTNLKKSMGPLKRRLPKVLKVADGVKRKRYWCRDIENYNHKPTTSYVHDLLPPYQNQYGVDGEDFNLISSLCDDGMHRPALDIDIPCHYVKSSTPGHGHLYFPTLEMDWTTYSAFIKMLASFGVLETKYVDHSLRQEQTLLRPPWVRK